MPFNLLIRLLTLSALLLGCQEEKSSDPTKTAIAPSAQVQTIKLPLTDLQTTLSVYGTVTSLPSALKTLSVPFASQIKNIYVSNGQSVRQGDPLLTLKPSEDALLAVHQARQELASATQELKLVQERVQLQLATQHELLTSQLRVAQAKTLVQDLTTRGSLQDQTLKTPSAGIIAAVTAQQGQRLPAASPLLQWLEQNQWGITLGVEPDAVSQLHLQQQVLLTPVNRSLTQAINGHITLISRQVDPVTHLLNILVTPEANANLLLNESMQGDITLATKRTLVAPRTSVLPDGDAYSVFTVVNQHAVKHRVELGLENATQVEVISPTLKVQDELVILGNYELQDGMAVEVTQP